LNDLNRLREDGYRPKAGDRVVARVSGAAGEIVKINRLNKSSPLVVHWDKSGSKSNENMSSVKPQGSED
jgi:hypothetical protein